MLQNIIKWNFKKMKMMKIIICEFDCDNKKNIKSCSHQFTLYELYLVNFLNKLQESFLNHFYQILHN